MIDDHDVGLAVANFITEYYLKSQLANDFDHDESNKGESIPRTLLSFSSLPPLIPSTPLMFPIRFRQGKVHDEGDGRVDQPHCQR